LHVNSPQKCNGPANLRPCGIGFSLCSYESPRCYAQITAGPTPQCVLHVNSAQKCNGPANLRPCGIGFSLGPNHSRTNTPMRSPCELRTKMQRPRKPLRGRRESVWDWLKARTPLRIQTSLGLKSSRLKPQPPHVFHYNRNFSLFWIDLLSRVPPS